MTHCISVNMISGSGWHPEQAVESDDRAGVLRQGRLSLSSTSCRLVSCCEGRVLLVVCHDAYVYVNAMIHARASSHTRVQHSIDGTYLHTVLTKFPAYRFAPGGPGASSCDTGRPLHSHHWGTGTCHSATKPKVYMNVVHISGGFYCSCRMLCFACVGSRATGRSTQAK